MQEAEEKVKDTESRLQEQVSIATELTNEKQTLEVNFFIVLLFRVLLKNLSQFECKLLHEQVEELQKEIDSGKVFKTRTSIPEE